MIHFLVKKKYFSAYSVHTDQCILENTRILMRCLSDMLKL